jgi:hypothetical protein
LSDTSDKDIDKLLDGEKSKDKPALGKKEEANWRLTSTFGKSLSPPNERCDTTEDINSKWEMIIESSKQMGVAELTDDIGDLLSAPAKVDEAGAAGTKSNDAKLQTQTKELAEKKQETKDSKDEQTQQVSDEKTIS